MPGCGAARPTAFGSWPWLSFDLALPLPVLRALRAGDVAGRLGGEWSAVLCPGLDPGEAGALAERLRAALGERMPHPAGGAAVATASAGVAALARLPPAVAVEQAVAAADRALYAAKAAGRDRVVLA